MTISGLNFYPIRRVSRPPLPYYDPALTGIQIRPTEFAARPLVVPGMKLFNGMSDWDLVVACLSPTKSTIKLTREADLAARLLCDGMGKLDRTRKDLVYDWIHVRDSSDEAITKCAAYIRRYLDRFDMVLVANDALDRRDMVTYYKALSNIVTL